MRTLVKVHITPEAEAAAVWKGSVQQILQEAMKELKPEAAFFTAEHGTRTAFFLLDNLSLAKIPVVCEPFFTDLGARIDMVPAMNLEEVRVDDRDSAQGTGCSGVVCTGSAERRIRLGTPRTAACEVTQGRSGESQAIRDSNAIHKLRIISEPRIIFEPNIPKGDSPAIKESAAKEPQIIEKTGPAGTASRECASTQERPDRGQGQGRDGYQGQEWAQGRERVHDQEPAQDRDQTRGRDRQIFVDPSGRRKKVVYYAALTVGCAFAGYLVLLVIVFFVAGQPPRIADPFTAERSPSRTSRSAAETPAEVRSADRAPAGVRSADRTPAEARPAAESAPEDPASAPERRR